MLPERIEVNADGRRVTYIHHDGDEYRIEGTDATARASGLVWMRFAEGTDAAARGADIERAGYRIDSVPGYATNAAFVHADDVATALANLDALRAIDGVEHVEPQMLMQRSPR